MMESNATQYYDMFTSQMVAVSHQQLYKQNIFQIFHNTLIKVAGQVDELGEYPDYTGTAEDIMNWFDEILEDLQRHVSSFRDVTGIPREPRTALMKLSDTMFDLWKQTYYLIDKQRTGYAEVVTDAQSIEWFKYNIVKQLDYAISLAQQEEERRHV